MERSRGDRGQVLPLLVLVLVAVVLVVFLVVRVGSATAQRARARTAADAAALAGATGGRDAADSAARFNGGSLDSFVMVGAEAEAVVRVGDEHASARARVDVEAAHD